MMIKRAIGSQARRLLSQPAYRHLCQVYDATRAAARAASCLGAGRECPFCRARLRRFLPDPGAPSSVFDELHVIGGGPFDQSTCPFCGSFERERHVFLYLRLMTDVFQSPMRMLHVAPELRLGRRLAQQANIDYASGDLTPGRAQLRVDLTAIEFADRSFDVVICNHVLEHIPDDRRAMAELFRVLRPGGWAMVQVPLAEGSGTRENPSITDPDEMLRIYGQHDHVRLYGSDDYARRLGEAGFVVQIDSIAQRYGEPSVRRYGLLREERIHVARKPVEAGREQNP